MYTSQWPYRRSYYNSALQFLLKNCQARVEGGAGRLPTSNTLNKHILNAAQKDCWQVISSQYFSVVDLECASIRTQPMYTRQWPYRRSYYNSALQFFKKNCQARVEGGAERLLARNTSHKSISLE